MLFAAVALAATTILLAPVRAASTGAAIPQDAIGAALQKTFIWSGEPQSQGTQFVAFRKRISLSAAPAQASLYLFADVRYMLWINGQYLSRGPVRFNPNGPEYDTVQVGHALHTGENEIVVLVMADQSNGKMMRHVPGLSARLDIAGGDGPRTLLTTDGTWKWSDKTRYRNPHINWGNEMDVIDSTVEDGDWTQLDYNEDAWKNAVGIDGAQWGNLSACRIPPLRDTTLDVTLLDGHQFPVTLTPGQQLRFQLDRLVQAYTVLDFDAAANSVIQLPYAGITYKAKAGRQLYISSDTHGFREGVIQVVSGSVTIHSFKVVERIYPFDCVGSFDSNDPLLNKLWTVCARSNQVMSEDAYVDCADRERTEWADDSPPAFDVTRVAMAGPGKDGAKVYADPRLLAELLRRTALTLQPDGWVKAHTCSDRFDIHARMEDRACDWVEESRLYCESTGDTAVIREIWPAIVAQMNYFLARRSTRGLVIGREWVIWGNPMGYQTCEGSGLNAFVYKALVDAAFLGNAIGETRDAATFAAAAKDLASAFNRVLWDDAAGAYYSGYATDPADLPAGTNNRRLALPVTNHLIAPTIFSALFALDQKIVPADRIPAVTGYLLSAPDPNSRMMFYYYYFKQLYDQDRPDLDQRVLDMMREKFKDMAAWPWQTTWEEFRGGSKAHCYGMYPAYFLSAFVLGVRLDGPAASRHLLINPHLGDLTSAKGIVVTEFGPVPITWQNSADRLDFDFTIPKGVSATLRLPAGPAAAQLVLDNQPIKTSASGSQTLNIQVKAGRHAGSIIRRPYSNG